MFVAFNPQRVIHEVNEEHFQDQSKNEKIRYAISTVGLFFALNAVRLFYRGLQGQVPPQEVTGNGMYALLSLGATLAIEAIREQFFPLNVQLKPALETETRKRGAVTIRDL